MRPKSPSKLSIVFSALGDETRLHLVSRLRTGGEQSISELSNGLAVSRQGVTKHLRVLEDAGVVVCEKVGREQRFQLRAETLEGARDYLARASGQWDDAIERLKAKVESPED